MERKSHLNFKENILQQDLIFFSAILEQMIKNKLHICRRHKFSYGIRIFMVSSLFLLSAFTSDTASEKHTIEAEAAGLVGGASRLVDSAVSGGYLVSLTGTGGPVPLIPDGSDDATRVLATTTTISPSATEPAMSGVVRLPVPTFR